MSRKEINMYLAQNGPIENRSDLNGCISRRPKTAYKHTATCFSQSRTAQRRANGKKEASELKVLTE